MKINNFLVVLVVLIVFLISACLKQSVDTGTPLEKNILDHSAAIYNESLIKVRVTPKQDISQEELQELMNKGLRLSYEGETLIGEVTEEEFEELKENPSVKEAKERIFIKYREGVLERGQITALDDQNAIDDLRERLNITGPYIESGVFDRFKEQEFVKICIRFRIGQNEEVYQSLIDEINSILSKNTPKIEYISGIKFSFCSNMIEQDVISLQNSSDIVMISYYRELTGVPRYKVLENGTKIRIN